MPSRPLRVLDLGTGNRVIGITLALERPNQHVSLSDISLAALAIAQESTAKFNLELPLIKSDLSENIDQQYDLTVINPPCIDLDDTGEISQAVLENEPALALFASGHELGFCHRLFKQAGQYLTTIGQIFGETGYGQEESTQELLYQTDEHTRTCPRYDVAGETRMTCAWDSSNVGGRQ